ncbi:hypothetical protein EQU50_00950 [Candidatus Finniella inopinata]|uniref:Uncharacterized protein n=2 Tax=Candidatus Finniella inopinata TaxID=1696036 RepID=A0A4Q7DJ11_9PROT|nr:hypothetical protein EQU50_00950 [Candidatus Finniella inopinata]
MIAHHEHPKSIIAHRPRVMKFGDDQKPTGYNSWPLYKNANHTEGDILFPTSGAGVLFPPHSLHPEALNTARFMALCPTGDDIFWFAMCVLQGTEIRAPSDAQTNIIDINDEEAKKVSLWDSTNRLGTNDVMIKAVFTAYDIYSRLKAHLKPMARNSASASESNDH